MSPGRLNVVKMIGDVYDGVNNLAMHVMGKQL